MTPTNKLLDVNELYSDLKVKYDNLKRMKIREASVKAVELGVCQSDLAEITDKLVKLQRLHDELLFAHRRLKEKCEANLIELERANQIIINHSPNTGSKN